MKIFEVVEVRLHSFLTSALHGDWVGSFMSGTLSPWGTPSGWTPEPVVSQTAAGNIRRKLHNPFRGPISTFCNEYKRPLFRCEASRGMKLTTYLHLVSRLITSAAVPPLPHTPSCCAEELFKLHSNQKQEHWQSYINVIIRVLS
jgi:hypothetical protein